MRALVFLPDGNRPGLSDYSGAFRVEADRLAAHHKLPRTAVIEVPRAAPADRQRAEVLGALHGEGAVPVDLVAFLCHGWRTGLQLGFSLGQAPQLAAALATARVRHVALYACSLAADGPGQAGTGGEGGFADLLRDAYARCLGPDGAPCRDFTVDAHDRSGHTTSNPYVRRFEGAAGPAVGGAWLVPPGGPLWRRWAEALGDRRGSPLRFDYPLLRRAEIETRLGGPAPGRA